MQGKYDRSPSRASDRECLSDRRFAQRYGLHGSSSGNAVKRVFNVLDCTEEDRPVPSRHRARIPEASRRVLRTRPLAEAQEWRLSVRRSNPHVWCADPPSATNVETEIIWRGSDTRRMTPSWQCAFLEGRRVVRCSDVWQPPQRRPRDNGARPRGNGAGSSGQCHIMPSSRWNATSINRPPAAQEALSHPLLIELAGEIRRLQPHHVDDAERERQAQSENPCEIPHVSPAGPSQGTDPPPRGAVSDANVGVVSS